LSFDPNIHIKILEHSVSSLQEENESVIKLAVDILEKMGVEEPESSMGDRNLSVGESNPAMQDLFQKILEVKKVPKEELEMFLESNKCHSVEEVVQKKLKHHLWSQVGDSHAENRYDSLSSLIEIAPVLEEDFQDISTLVTSFDELATKIDKRLESLEKSYPQSWTPTEGDKQNWPQELNGMRESWNRLQTRIKEYPPAVLFSDNEDDRKKEYYVLGIQFGRAFENLTLKEEENLAFHQIEAFLGTCHTGWEEQIGQLNCMGQKGPSYQDPTLEAFALAQMMRRSLVEKALRQAIPEFASDVHYQKAAHFAMNEEFHLGLSKEELGTFEPNIVAFVRSLLIQEAYALQSNEGANDILISVKQKYKEKTEDERNMIFEELLQSYEESIHEDSSLLIDPFPEVEKVVRELSSWAEGDSLNIEHLQSLRKKLVNLGIQPNFSSSSLLEKEFSEIKRTPFFVRLMFKNPNLFGEANSIQFQISEVLKAFDDLLEKPPELSEKIEALKKAMDPNSDEQVQYLNNLRKRVVSEAENLIPRLNKGLLQKQLLENETFGAYAWALHTKVLRIGESSESVHEKILNWIQELPFSATQKEVIFSAAEGKLNSIEEGSYKALIEQAIKNRSIEELQESLSKTSYFSLEEVLTFGNENDLDDWMKKCTVEESDLIEGVGILVSRGHIGLLKKVLSISNLSEENRKRSIRVAVEFGRLEVVEELLKGDESLQSYAVLISLIYQKVELLKELLKGDESLQSYAINVAVLTGEVEVKVLKELLKGDESLQLLAVKVAVANEKVEILKELLKGDKSLQTLTVKIAIANEEVEILKELLKGDESLQLLTVKIAVARKKVEILKELLKGDKSLQTLTVKIAIANEEVEILKELLKSDAFILTSDRFSAVQFAVEQGDLELLNELLKDHENLRRSAVRAAVEQVDLGLVNELLKGHEDLRGLAVEVSLAQGNLELVNELLKDHEDLRGLSLKKCIEKDDVEVEIINYLLKGHEDLRGLAVQFAVEQVDLGLVNELLKGHEDLRGLVVKVAAEQGNLELLEVFLKDKEGISNEDRNQAKMLAKGPNMEKIKSILDLR
jgi:hypothetical protein